MKSVLLILRSAAVRITFALARHLALRDHVVLATTHADALGGNLAAIRDGLARRSPGIHVVALVDPTAPGWRGRLRSLWRSVQAGYHLATARLFIVDDYFFPIYVIRPREGTSIVQTWHASGAFKRFGYSVLDRSFGLDAATAERVRIHANYDVCLVGSSGSIPAFSEAFGQPASRFRTDLGIPRTDVLFGEEHIAALQASLRGRYAVPSDRRVVLYAPTFRGDHGSVASSPTDLDLGRLHARLGQDHVVLVRLHPFVRSSSPIDPSLRSFVIDVSSHPDINELLLIADVLITDYSSVIFEYALLARPMIFFAPDLESYERERGFYRDYRSSVPGPVVETTDEVADLLESRTADPDRVRAFSRASFDIADGHSTDRFIDAIVVPALVHRA